MVEPVVCSSFILVNPHKRDARIMFEDADHKYILDGSLVFPLSVSGVSSMFFEEFNAEATISRYFQKWSTTPSNKYYSVIQDGHNRDETDEEIKANILKTWSEKGQRASRAGTYMHKQIELFLNARADYDAQRNLPV